MRRVSKSGRRSSIGTNFLLELVMMEAWYNLMEIFEIVILLGAFIGLTVWVVMDSIRRNK